MSVSGKAAGKIVETVAEGSGLSVLINASSVRPSRAGGGCGQYQAVACVSPSVQSPDALEDLQNVAHPQLGARCSSLLDLADRCRCESDGGSELRARHSEGCGYVIKTYYAARYMRCATRSTQTRSLADTALPCALSPSTYE